MSASIENAATALSQLRMRFKKFIQITILGWLLVYLTCDPAEPDASALSKANPPVASCCTKTCSFRSSRAASSPNQTSRLVQFVVSKANFQNAPVRLENTKLLTTSYRADPVNNHINSACDSQIAHGSHGSHIT